MKRVLLIFFAVANLMGAAADSYLDRYLPAESGDELDASCERELLQCVALSVDSSMPLRLLEHSGRVIGVWSKRGRPESVERMGGVIAALRAQSEAVAREQPGLGGDYARLWVELSLVCMRLGYDDGAKLGWSDFAEAMCGRGTPFANVALQSAAPRCAAAAKRDEILALLSSGDLRDDVGEIAAELWRMVAPTEVESRQVAENGSDVAVASLLLSLAPIDEAILTLLSDRAGQASRPDAKPRRELAPYLDRLVATESTGDDEGDFSGISDLAQLLRVVAETVDEAMRSGVAKEEVPVHVDWIAARIAKVSDTRAADWLATFVERFRG